MKDISFNFFEGKKRKKVKPKRLKFGNRVVRYSRIDQWLKAIQSLIKDIEELELAKKKAQKRMKKIKARNNTESSERPKEAGKEEDKSKKKS